MQVPCIMAFGPEALILVAWHRLEHMHDRLAGCSCACSRLDTSIKCVSELLAHTPHEMVAV